MKRRLGVSLAAILGLACLVNAYGAESKKPPSNPGPAWDAMKSLVGEWDGLYDGKVPVKATYRLVSNGTALMETLNAPGESEMVTIYHPDGSRLLMTHYCSDDNQPRMRAEAKDGKRIAFRYVDATNLSSPDAPHMTGLVVTVSDADHFSQEWTHKGGDHAMSTTFSYTRKR